MVRLPLVREAGYDLMAVSEKKRWACPRITSTALNRAIYTLIMRPSVLI